MDDFMSEDDRLALKKFESMLQSNKVYFFDSEEFEEIVYHYMDLGKLSLANKAIDLSLSQHPTSLALKLIKVELLIFQNKHKLASKLLNHIASVNPLIHEIYIHKAAIASKSDDHDEAIIQLSIALDFADDDEQADVYALLGMEYLFVEKFKDAIDHFDMCLDVDVEDYAALYNIVYCFDMLDNHTEAIEYLNEYIDRNPYSEIAWHQLGRQYLNLKKYEDAIRAFDYAILIDEQFIGAYLEKGKALEAEKKYKEAITNYMITLELDDPTAFTFLQVGYCYKQLNDYNLALGFLHKAVEEDPLLDKAWLMLTDLYFDLNENQKALVYINQALDVDATNTDFLNRYAEISIRLNLFEEAVVAFRESINLGDERLVIFMALADLLHYIGEYNDAKDVLIQAAKKYKNAIEIEYRLAGIHFLLHEDQQAMAFLEKALQANLNYKKTAQDLFPEMFLRNEVIQLISKFI